MKICPLCNKQYSDTEDVCSEDGAELIKRKVTLPWEMEAPAGEDEAQSDEGMPPGVTKSDTFMDLNPDDTVDIQRQHAKAKKGGQPTLYELAGDEPTVDGGELSSEVDLSGDTIAEEFPPILPGTVMGSYRLDRKLGEGGMGEVFLAEHTKLGRKVAIKVLRSEYSHNQNAVDRFFNEARAVNQIAHRHIVQITDFFEQPGGQNYYVMEYLKGRSLQDILFSEGGLNAPDIVHIGVQIASALDAVHKQNIIHRDLKPENIIILNSDELDNYVKLLDFGVAKLLEPTNGEELHKTQTGVIMGTPEYMAPEQLKREPVTPRTDIYAFGLILFEMSTGCRPWKYDNMGELVVAHMTKIPPKINQVSTVAEPLPMALEILIASCLEKDPAKRPSNMKEVAEQLSTTLQSAPGVKRSPEMMMSGGHRLNPVPTQPPQTMITGGLDASAIERAVQDNQNRTTLWIGMIFLLLITGVSGVASQWEALFPKDNTPKEDKVGEQFPAMHLNIKEIVLNLDSKPSGAFVFDEKEDVALGKTPLELTLIPSMKARTFIFSKDGFHKLKKEINISYSSKTTVELLVKQPTKNATKATPKPSNPKIQNTRKWVKPKAPKQKTKQSNDKSGLIDPFSM